MSGSPLATHDDITRTYPICRISNSARDAGYDTAAFVAAEYVRSEFGLDQGFELYDDDFEGPSRPATEYQGQILDWLEEHRDKRFFLWVHYFTPHTPYRPSADFDRLYYEGDERDPGNKSMEDLRASVERLQPQQDDPDELVDLAAEYPNVVERLANQLGPLRDLVVLGDAPERELDEETLRRLRALGYAQ